MQNADTAYWDLFCVLEPFLHSEFCILNYTIHLSASRVHLQVRIPLQTLDRNQR
jgi:hypothetical protein